jgi:hypothetical protein
VVLVALLDEESHTALLAGNDTDGLVETVSTKAKYRMYEWFRKRYSRCVYGRIVPCWQSGPHSVAVSVNCARISTQQQHTLRLYLFLRLRGSRENCTPLALLTSVALCPSAHNQSSLQQKYPMFQCITHW